MEKLDGVIKEIGTLRDNAPIYYKTLRKFLATRGVYFRTEEDLMKTIDEFFSFYNRTKDLTRGFKN